MQDRTTNTSDMDEQKYLKALDQAKKELSTCDSMDCDAARLIFRLFPQLAESEDERMIKLFRAIASMPVAGGYFEKCDIDYHDALAWLEKQKELFSPQQLQEHLDMQWEHIKQDMFDATINYDDYGHLIVPVDECDLSYGEKVKVLVMKVFDDKEKQKEYKPFDYECANIPQKDYAPVEQKPAESISQLTVQGKGVYKICPRCKERMVRDDSMVYTSMPPQYRYECPKCGESKCDTVLYDNPEMQEQKPAEPSGKLSRQDYLYQLLIDQLITYSDYEYLIGQKPAEWTLPKDFEEAVYKVANFISPFDSQEELRKVSHRFAEQLLSLAKKELDKPAEWSDTKELVFKDICNHLKEEGYSGWVLLLNALRNGEFQPKPEWSEEDEEMIKMILGDLEWERRNTTVDKDIRLYDEKIAWLKSLKPQSKQKWSKEDQWILDCIIEELYDTTKEGEMDADYPNEIEYQVKWLKNKLN